MSSKKIFTSDLHFDHKRITEFTDRKLFTTPEDHTEWLIDLWNSQVNGGDIVYHIGDFSFAKEVKDILRILDRLNGQKFFLKSNHDQSGHTNTISTHSKVLGYEDYEEIKLGDRTACLMHFPIASWHKQNYGSYMLHGHSHGGYKGQGKILDVGIDSAYNLFNEHKFFTEEMIHEYMSRQEIHITDSHRKEIT